MTGAAVAGAWVTGFPLGDTLGSALGSEEGMLLGE
jgi:hypothetical protein